MKNTRQKNVKVRISGVQHFALEDNLFIHGNENYNWMFDDDDLSQGKNKNKPVKMSLICDGMMKEHKGDIEISYEEDITGINGAQTKLFVGKNGIITMTRMGSVYTHMVFEDGKRHICNYSDGFYPVSLCVTTKKLKSSFDENGGKINIDYMVEIGGNKTEHSEFKINILNTDAEVNNG